MTQTVVELTKVSVCLNFQAMESTAISCDDEGKNESEVEEEEEEALSLCDLPVNLIKGENQVQPSDEEDDELQAIKTDEDFNFGSWGGGSLSTEPEMCAADEVFFQGQILPLCLSVSSVSGFTGCQQDSQHSGRCLSRSESMDHGSLSRFTIVTSSSRSNNSVTVKARNFNSITSSNAKFNPYPCPKPPMRLSKTRPANVCSRNQRSSMWDFFRLGLVRAPELELLQGFKVRINNNHNNAKRNSFSQNSSCNSSNSSSSTKNSKTKSCTEVAKNKQDLNKGFLEKRIGMYTGCKCSADAVETVPLNSIVVTKNNKNNEKDRAMLPSAREEKKKKKMKNLQQKLKAKKKIKEKEKDKRKSKEESKLCHVIERLNG